MYIELDQLSFIHSLRDALQNEDFLNLLAFLFALWFTVSVFNLFIRFFNSVVFYILQRVRFYFWFRKTFSVLPKIDPIDYDYFCDLMCVEYSSFKDILKE